ncbi:Crp/Fnr family transcriptional regulator [Nitrosomonas communis]|uniref:cAMP-binding domain of CRP or a regulatory subunit of cAMP-dependent protein kinases n=1 Tax=Nitrosomonas communis TaxID=44574 RepID=A0A1I4W713_9PROT|nr:Crp/Fnr family transcriptional regulator [Nitrosomonas communis]SFN08996.1 cAMP-binding domain of CRP or a regulatory subunit of cAMP-dependent protein kinases [Nitrosomonas communis]
MFSDIKEFHGLSSVNLGIVIQSFHQQHSAAGEEIVRYQDHNNSVFFVLKGMIRVHYYALSGDEVILCDLPAGEMFGELTAIDGLPRSATAIAKTDSLLASIPDKTFWELIHTYPAFCNAILRRLTGQVRRLTERVFDFSTLAVRNRIHAELWRLARERMVSLNTAIISPAPLHAELACFVSAHREAVSREFASLAKINLIEQRGRNLHILDVAKLAKLVKEVQGSLD